jgi:transketolase
MREKKAIRESYGEALVEIGKTNDKIVVLDADLAEATKTILFKKAFPNRHFEVGIAEADLIDIGVGMSTMGLIPFCSSFAVFAGRAFEMIRNSVCYPANNVKLAFTHAGLSVGEDGGSHQAIEDVALMRVLPNMTVIAPCDDRETRKAVKAAIEIEGPVYLRLARLPTAVFDDMPFTVGKANVIREGKDVAVFCYGVMVEICLDAADILAAQGMDVAVINMHTLKPLDEDILRRYAAKTGNVVTAEEASVIGGLGDAAAAVLAGSGKFRFTKIGIEDRFGQSGKPLEVMREYGLCADQVAAKILATR